MTMACENRDCSFCNGCLICGAREKLQGYRYHGVGFQDTSICERDMMALGGYDRHIEQKRGFDYAIAAAVKILTDTDHPRMAERVAEIRFSGLPLIP
jgi:hypothetical protein